MIRETAIETFIDLLKQGNSAELSAIGYSMFPTLRPGDKALIKPFNNNKPAVPGIIIVARRDNTLVMHRLIEISKDATGNTEYVTRGDSTTENDPSWQADQIIGLVEYCNRKGKKHKIKTTPLSKLNYRNHRRYLWLHSKFKKYLGRSPDNINICIV
jgi:signal peptidase I